jgi:hypothetical protein
MYPLPLLPHYLLRLEQVNDYNFRLLLVVLPALIFSHHNELAWVAVLVVKFEPPLNRVL